MKKNSRNIALGFVLVGIAGVVVYHLPRAGKPADYHDFGYQQDCQWQDIEAGTLLRRPRDRATPTGRHAVVVAFPTGQPEAARILLSGPKAEVPSRPEFVEAKASEVVYRVERKTTRIDLGSWRTYPRRSDTSTMPLDARPADGPV